MENHEVKLMNDYNQRQFLIMEHKIQSFKEKKIGIQILINDLDALLNTLKSPSQEFLDIFSSKWGVMEDIYSEGLFTNTKRIPRNLELKLNEALNDLENLIKKEKLKE